MSSVNRQEISREENAFNFGPKSGYFSVLKLPLYKCKRKGDCAFSYSGPSVWNSLPLHIRNATTTDTFKSALKTHLFNLQDFD